LVAVQPEGDASSLEGGSFCPFEKLSALTNPRIGVIVGSKAIGPVRRNEKLPRLMERGSCPWSALPVFLDGNRYDSVRNRQPSKHLTAPVTPQHHRVGAIRKPVRCLF
jgi:hypothetical protein